MRTLTIFSLLLMFCAALVPIPAAHAQTDPVNSATLTEGFINAALTEALPPDSNLSNLRVDLQPGQIVLQATVAGEQGPVELSLTLVPTVIGGRVEWDATAISLGGFEIGLGQFNQSGTGAATMGDLQSLVNTTTAGQPVESLTITDSELTLTWLRMDPAGPAFDLRDTALSMTVTEDYVNALPAVTNPDNPDLYALSVDFQPGQIVLDGTRFEPDGRQVPISVTFTPTLYNGTVTWAISAMVVGGTAEDEFHVAQMNDDIAGSWRNVFNGLYRSGSLTEVLITDTALTLTWDASLDTTTQFELGDGTLVIDEAAINEALVVSSPPSYRITDVYADLQPGQVVLTANLNLNDGTVITERAVFVPDVSNGVIVWTITEVTLDGTPLDYETISRFNEATSGWWRGLVWGQMGRYAVTDITVTDSAITIQGAPR